MSICCTYKAELYVCSCCYQEVPPCYGACRNSSSKWHKFILHGLDFLHGLYLCLVGTRAFFDFIASSKQFTFFVVLVFLRPLDRHRRIVAQLQLFLFIFRLCLCDLAWLIFHATALRKYLSTSSTVKTSSTSTYDTILWDHVEQGVLTPFAGLQRIIFLLHLEFCTCASRDEGKGVYCLFLWDVKRLIFRKL